MKTIIISILFTTILLISCKEKEKIEMCANFQLEETTLTNDLDYEIINTILDSIYSNVNYMHILQKTYSTVNVEGLKTRLKNKNIEIDTLILLHYKDQNNQSYFLSDKFKQENIELISNDEFMCFFSDANPYSGWENYYGKYNSSFGQCTFQRPGFNTNINKAIIEYGWMAGADKGEGYVVILEKTDDGWEIIHYFVTWVS